MAITLHPWTHPKTGELRLYVNGLAGQSPRQHKIFARPSALDPCAPFLETDGASSGMLTEAMQYFRGKTWADLVTLASGQQPAPIPAPVPAPPLSLRGVLESAGIVYLAPAARMAGLAFKNGTLTKAQIIDKLMLNEQLAQRAVDALAQLQNNAPAPAKPAPDWLDDDAPAPQAPQAQSPTRDLPDLSEYARVTYVDGEVRSLRKIAQALETERDAHKARIDALQKRIEESQPLVITLPNKPEPVKVNGLRHAMFETALRAAQAGVHIMLVGPAGSGKTYAAEQIAQALSLKYHKQPPVNYAHEILGHFDAHNRYHRTPTREAVEHGGLLNLDEFDASSADAGLACNQVADSSSSVAFPDGMIAKHKDFVIIAGTNTDGSGATMEYAGRARLDGATLNRFALIQWGYDPRVEDSIGAPCPEWVGAVRAIRAFAKARGILDVCATMRDIATGVRLLGAGLSRESVLEMTQKRGALSEAWADITRLPAVATFLRG